MTDASLRVAVTGAGGFIGRAVVDRILRGALGAVGELRLNDLVPVDVSGAAFIPGSCADEEVRDALLAGGVDVLFHLASLPGGASERDPVLGRRVNLDGSIALLDTAAGTGAAVGERRPIVVYASSIAALGHHAGPVNDATALRPNGSYGTHKAMVELYLADLTRRGLIDGRAVRPAGIVARPKAAYAGFATAWMSDLFHAAVEGRPITVPARPSAHVWLQSIAVVADNIIHAALMDARTLPPHRAWTLPATVARIDALAAALERRTARSLAVAYGDAAIDHPPLDASAALSLGFLTDGDTDQLVDTVVAAIEAG